MSELVWLCGAGLLAGHCWAPSSGQEREQLQPREGVWLPVLAVVEPLEGSRASGFGILLRGKIPLRNISLKIERQLAVADLSVSDSLSLCGSRR